MRTQRQDQPAARAAGDTVDRSESRDAVDLERGRSGSRNGIDVDRDRNRSRDSVGIDRERQRDEFGGLNWGAAFFGWLVAVGVATLLTAILSAAGAAIGLTKTSPSQAADSASTIGGTRCANVTR